MTKYVRFLLVFALLVGVAITAQAQKIRVGDEVDGEDSDEIVEYAIDLDAGEVIEISLTADWDTYLELYDDDGVMVAYNDDGGDGLNSLILFVVEDSGTYFIRVRAFGGDTPDGDYELSVESVEITELVDGGMLEYDDNDDVDADNALAIEFTFEGTAGDLINIITVSENYYNTYIILLDPDGEEVTESDNAWGDASLRLVELEQTGTYTIRIEEFEGNVLDGEFDVEVQLTDEINLDTGAVTVEIGDGDDYTFVQFTAVEDTTYELTMSFDDAPDTYSEVSVHILEEGQSTEDYSDYVIRMTGGSAMSYTFEADDDGVYLIRIEYYGYDDLDMTLEIAPVIADDDTVDQ